NRGLARPHVDDLRVGLGDGERADGGDRLAVEQRLPGEAGVGGSPYAPVHSAEVERRGVAGDAGRGQDPAATVGTDEPPGQRRVARLRRGDRLGAGESARAPRPQHETGHEEAESPEPRDARGTSVACRPQFAHDANLRCRGLALTATAWPPGSSPWHYPFGAGSPSPTISRAGSRTCSISASRSSAKTGRATSRAATALARGSAVFVEQRRPS